MFKFLRRRRQTEDVQNALTPMQLEELARRVRGVFDTESGVSVTTGTAEGLAAVGVCYRYLSDILASLPLVLYRRTGEKTREKARDLPLYDRLYQRPNPMHTSMQWRKMGVRDLLFRGNWYNFKVPELGQSHQLVRLHPDQVTPRRDRATGFKVYDYQPPLGSAVTYSEEQVLHFWFDSDDGLIGLNPIQVYRNTIGDGLAIREHGSRFFKNAARLSGVLQIDKGVSMSEESQRALLADFESMYTGGQNAHRAGILPDGVSFEPVSINMSDAQWIEARKATAREIYGIFGVPPHKGGDLADATFSNIENENIGAVIDAIAPRCTALEQCLNVNLVDDPDLFVKFNLSALLRGDFKARQEGLNIQRRAGVINANEWRGVEDMNPRDDEGGEEYIVEQNMRQQDGRDPEDTTQ